MDKAKNPWNVGDGKDKPNLMDFIFVLMAKVLVGEEVVVSTIS